MKKLSIFSVSLMALFLIACSSSAEDEVVTEEAVEVNKSTVNVTMSEWDVNVNPNYKMGKHIKPGELTLILTNEGMLEHNLVLLNNNKHEELEMSADGTMADESKLDILGVIEGLKPGETGQLVIDDLPAGTYAFICNTPGHYSEEMVYKIIAR